MILFMWDYTNYCFNNEVFDKAFEKNTKDYNL